MFITLKHLVVLSLAAVFCMTAASNFIQSLISLRAGTSQAREHAVLTTAPHSTVEAPTTNGAMRGVQLSDFIPELAASDTPLLKAAAAFMAHEQIRGECDVEAIKQQVSWNKGDGRLRDIGICLQIKNDAAILDEYIAFHWLQVSAFLVPARV